MKLLKLSIFFFFLFSAFNQKLITPTVEPGITSLGQACSTQPISISSFNVTTVEQAHMNLYDVFSGSNLQITPSQVGGTPGVITLTNTVTQSATYQVPNNLKLLFFDVYQTNQVQLMQDANGNYFVQQWTQPTPTVGPDAPNSTIPVVTATTTKCFSVKYVNSFTVVVDCEDITQNNNYLYFVNLVKSQIDQVAPTQLLHSNLTSSNNRDMQIVIQNERVYILRTTLYNDWIASAGVNVSTIYTFTEVARVIGIWSTFRPIQVFNLPPIQYPGANMNMQVVAVAMNSGKLYLLDQLNQALWKINLDFTYITYIQDVEQIGIRGSMTKPLAIASSVLEFSSIVIAYQGYYKGVAGVYMEELNPNTHNNGPVFLLDSQTTNVYQLGFGVHMLYVIYSNTVQTAFGIYIRGDYFQMPSQSNTTVFAPMIYQQMFPTGIDTAMMIDEITDQILISQLNTLTTVFTQQIWNIAYPKLIIAQATAGTSTITVNCYSGFQAFNSTAVIPTTTQASQTLKVNFVAPNYVMGMLSPFGPFSTGIGAQTLTIPTPGQEVIDLDAFYIAPALQYTVALTPSTASPTGWSQDIFQVYNTYLKFQNTSFVFKVNDGTTLSVGSITFIKPQFIIAGRYNWLIETNTDKIYNFVEDEATQNNTFSEMGQPLDVTKFLGTLISLEYFGPEQWVSVGTDFPCTIGFFTASHTQNFWTTQLCETAYQKITKLKISGPNLYVIIQGLNATASNDYNNVIQLQVSNYTFRSQVNFNQMVSSQQVITGSSFNNLQFNDFVPVDVYAHPNRADVIFIKCTNYVLVYAMPPNYILYQAIPTWTAPTSYAVAVTRSSLILIQASKVEEYMITDLTRIYRIRSQYPYYGTTTQSYLIGDNQFAFSGENLYLYEQTTKTLQVFITGEMIPMVFMLYNQISLPVAPTFMFLTHEFMTHFEQITLLGTSYCAVYNIFRRRTLAVSGYFNNSLLPAGKSQQYQFTLTASSAVGTVNLPAITYTLTTTAVPLTNITLNNNAVNSGFIKMTSQSATNMVFNFPAFSWFSGTVTHYNLQCLDYPQECQTSIFMQSPIGPERLMGNDPFVFWDMASGVNNFSFVQTKDKILRLTGSENKIYDLVQLPFGEPYRFCLKMAVDPLAQYSVSACTDFSGEGWGFYFVSYLSTEPHMMGHFYDSHPSFIGKMTILGNYLFVFEADPFSDGIHIYQIDFDEDFGDAGSYQYTMPHWLIHLHTIRLNDTIFIRDVKNVDIQPTSSASIFRVFFASSYGEFLSLDVNPNNQPEQLIVNVYYDDFTKIVSSLDTGFSTMLSQRDFDNSLGGFLAFEFNATTTADQYTFILAYKHYHAYELQVLYQKSATTSGQFTSVSFTLKIRYQRYAFYSFENNIKALPGDGFVILSGFLPDYLSHTKQNYSEHLFMAYDRTNSSFQQQAAGTTFVDSYLMGAYPFKNKALFPYMTQKFIGLSSNNYSITLISPDNFTFFSYTLERQAGIKITSGSIKSNNLQITATSEFQSSQVRVNIGRDFSTSKKKHPYWVIGVVLGAVALIVICAVAYWYFKKKQSGSAYTLGEENNNQQGLAEGS